MNKNREQMRSAERTEPAGSSPSAVKGNVTRNNVIDVLSKLGREQLASLAQRLNNQKGASLKPELPPLAPAPRNGAFPLSYAQQRLWFIEQLGPGAPVYNFPVALELKGRLDFDALRRVIDEIVRRHESLRTRFQSQGGEPAQIVDRWEPRGFEVIDLTCFSQKEREKEARHIAREEAGEGFDLSRGPLFRVKALKLDKDEHLLLFTLHHIITDGWSMQILRREVETLYQAYCRGEGSPLPDLPVQYVDFAVWQREWLQGEALESELVYWRSQLTGMEDLKLPIDHPRPSTPSYRGARYQFVIERELAEKVRDLGRQAEVTLYMTLLGCFIVVMSRYSGQQDIVIGTDIANRNRAEIENLIGFFVNQLALRIKIRAGENFLDLLRDVKDVCLGAYAHQDAPFEKLVEELQPVRDLSRSPLFQVKMILQTLGEERLTLGEAKQRFSDQGTLTYHQTIPAKFDLTLEFRDGGNLLTGFVEYSQDLFEEESIERLSSCYTNVLREIIKDSKRPITELNLLTEVEREQILVKWNDTKTIYPQDKCIHELFEQQVERTPDAVALIYEEESLTYAELNASSNRLANYLQRLGVGPETIVGLCVERNLSMAMGMLSILKAGGAYLPLDPSYPAARTAFMMEDAQIKVLFTDQRTMQEPPANHVQVVMADSIWSKGFDESQENLPVRATPGNLAYVIYTSGSTGRPKGVAAPHRQVVNFFTGMDAYIKPASGAVWLAVTSICFDISVLELLWTLTRGCRVLIHGELQNNSSRNKTEAGAIEAEKQDRLAKREDYSIITQLTQHQISHLQCTPSLARLLSQEMDGDFEVHSLQMMLIGGEAFPVSLIDDLKQFGKAEIRNMYGPTETAIWSTSYAIQGDENRVPIGRPVANTQIYILDRELEIVPVGTPGEMYIGGEGVTRGYLGQSELTADRFTPDPFGVQRGRRLYRTGDLTRYLADGKIEFLGRIDHQVKIKGFRIELGEIEAQLNTHPAVRECAVLVQQNETGEQRLVAYAVCEGDSAPDSSQLLSYLKQSLPDYMLPGWFVWLEQMPLTPNGKLNRRALPTPDFAATKREYEPPVGETEQELTLLWSEMLKLERVGRYDHFFELGGHSLLAVRLIERMRQKGLFADVREIFTSPILADFARAVGAENDSVELQLNGIPQICNAITPEMILPARLSAAEIESIVSSTPGGAANIQDIYPLAPLQEGVLFHHLMESEGDPYLMHSYYSFDTRGRLARFLEAMQKVIDRHDILRTAFFWQGLPEAVQVVWRRASLRIDEVEPDHPAGDIVEQLITQFNPRHYRIDIQQAPLMRICIAYDAKNECWVMLHLYHRLLGDQAALRVLQQEIQAILMRRETDLPAPLPFRNFVVQTRSGGHQEHEAFFKSMLEDVSEPTAPFVLLDARRDGSAIREAQCEIDGQLSARIRQCAKTLGVTSASLFHLAWALVLARTSCRDDVVFGTVLLGRMLGGVDPARAPGLFINTLPIRIRVDETSLKESIEQTHQLLAQLLRHEHTSLALAQRCSGVPYPTPLFCALLNYRHSASPRTVAKSLFSVWEGIEFLGGEERNNYPLTLNVDDFVDGFSLTSQALAPIEPERICAYMQTALESLVEALERSAETAIRNLEILPTSERRQLLVEWNQTAADYSSRDCIHTLFEAQAAVRPDAIAAAQGENHLSYASLNGRANQLARCLLDLGVRPATQIAVLLDRSIELILAELAAIKCGAAYTPLDWNAPVERQAFIIKDCQASLTLTVKDVKIPETIESRRVDLDELTLDGYDSNNLALPLPSETPAYVIYTSGSTGRPKGVVVPHRAIGRLIFNNGYFAFESTDRAAMTSNPAFDASTVEIWAPLLHGACIALVPQSVLLEPDALTDFLVCNEIDVLHLVAGLMSAYADQLSAVFPRLRCLMTGGDLVDPRAVAKVLQQSPPQRLIHCYGPTESTTFAATDVVCAVPEGAKNIPIGRPIANTQIYILDSRMDLTPLGVVGELYIGGKGVVHGYLGQPELSAERFQPNLFDQEPGARLYRTGDLGRYLDDGKIEFLGRLDHQVKIRGFRIEPGEIEHQLSAHPSVRQCTVMAHGKENGEKYLIAYAAYNGENAPDDGELRSFLKERLPEYMLPSGVVWLKQMPLTPNGKIDRQVLAKLEITTTSANAIYVAPRTAVEAALAAIFKEVLKLERIGVHDDFFHLGGHSILAIQLISRVKEDFDMRVEMRSLFQAPTVAAFAMALIDQETTPGRTEKVARILQRLNAMSEQDIHKELAGLEQSAAYQMG